MEKQEDNRDLIRLLFFHTFFFQTKYVQNEELSQNSFIFFKKLFVQLLQVSEKCLPLQPQSREIAIKK